MSAQVFDVADKPYFTFNENVVQTWPHPHIIEYCAVILAVLHISQCGKSIPRCDSQYQTMFWVHPRKAQQFLTVYYKVTQLSFSGYTVAYFTGHKMCSSCLGVHRSICLPVCLPSCLFVCLSLTHSNTEFNNSCLPEVTLLKHADSMAHISDLAFLDSFPTAITKLQSVYRFNQTEAVLA